MAGKIWVLILTITVLFISAVNNYADTSGNEIIKDPYKYIAREINNKKIVMLADFQSSTMISNLSLLNTLYNWNEINIHNKLQNQSLTLVLELSSQEIELIKTYLDKNDLSPWLDRFSLSFSLEDIYMIETLKKIKNEIEKNKCRLNITGFEEYFTNEIYFTRNAFEKDKWFVNVKDSLVANKTIKYVESNPEEKILFYYSGAHLNNGYLNKFSLVSELTPEESNGYFLAYYLKRHFGEQYVVTFNQVSIKPELLDKTEYARYKNEQFIVKGSDSTICNINFTNPYCDWTVVRHEKIKPPTQIKFIMSFANLLRLKDDLEEYDSLNKKYTMAFVNGPALEPLPYLTGNFFNSIRELRNWVDSNKIMLFNVIFTKEYSDLLFRSTEMDPKTDPSLRNNLASMGFDSTICNENYKPTREEWDKKIWPEASHHVKYLNAVGILWIGDEDEKKAAKKHLVKETNVDYNSPATYLELYYNRIYGYSFPYRK